MCQVLVNTTVWICDCIVTSWVASHKLQANQTLLLICNPFPHRDCEGRGCLHYAASYGHDSCVEVLLGHSKCDPMSQDGHGDLALHFAAIHGHPMCAYHLARVSCLSYTVGYSQDSFCVQTLSLMHRSCFLEKAHG